MVGGALKIELGFHVVKNLFLTCGFEVEVFLSFSTFGEWSQIVIQFLL